MLKKIRNIVLSLMVLTVLGAGSVWAYMDSRQDRIDEHMARVKAAQEATASISIPTPSPEPTPTAPSVPKTTPKSASNIQTEPTAECMGEDGKIFITTLSNCLSLHANKQPQSVGDGKINCYTKYGVERLTESGCKQAKESDAYYEAEYNRLAREQAEIPTTWTMPKPPEYEYTPSYPDPFVAEPFPTIGPSYNPNEICETRSTNAGSITVCR